MRRNVGLATLLICAVPLVDGRTQPADESGVRDFIAHSNRPYTRLDAAGIRSEPAASQENGRQK